MSLDFLAAAADDFDPPTDPWLADPAGWVGERCSEFTWSAQVAMMESVRDHRRTAVPAAHGPGKSWTAARLACWWIDTHPVGTAFVVTTAPTDKQVKAILWREISRAHSKGHLDGEVLQTAEWKIGGQLVAYGRKPADHDDDAFQGIHDPYVLVILDEASGVPKTLWTAASTLMTNEDARILAGGNPDDPAGEFARICEGADPWIGGVSALGWNVIPIPAFATPEFTGETVPAKVRRALTSKLWAEDFARQMGGPALVEAHLQLTEKVKETGSLSAALLAIDERHQETIAGAPLYVSKVLARFPEDVADGVVPWSWLRACMNHLPGGSPRHLGVDVGGSDAGDETVVYERVGSTVGRRWSIRSADPERVADAVCEAIDEAEPDEVKIDSIGIGWGVMGLLRRARPRTPVTGVNVAEAATDKQRFLNLRSEIWWEIARGLSKDRAWDLTGIGESTLAELAAPRWREDKTGRIVIESKDDIRKRLGRSTDNADALLLAFYQTPTPNVRWLNG